MEMRFTFAVSRSEKLTNSLVMRPTEDAMTALEDPRKRLRSHRVDLTSE